MSGYRSLVQPSTRSDQRSYVRARERWRPTPTPDMAGACRAPTPWSRLRLAPTLLLVGCAHAGASAPPVQSSEEAVLEVLKANVSDVRRCRQASKAAGEALTGIMRVYVHDLARRRGA